MMVISLCMTYILFESSFDRFHANSERIYTVLSVMENDQFSDNVLELTNHKLKDYIDRTVPESASVCRIKTGSWDMQVSEKEFDNQSLLYVDPEFFEVFDWNMLAGNSTSLAEPGNVMLSSSMAKKLFQDKDPLGQTIILNKDPFRITGIVEDAPRNSSVNYEILVPMVHYVDYVKSTGHPFRFVNVRTFIKTRTPIQNEVALADQLAGYYSGVEDLPMKPQLMPLTKVHQFQTASKKTFIVFVTISLLVLIVAMANYINLFSAHAETRVREIGIRKLSGASRQGVIRILLTESIVTCFLAALIGLVLSEMVLDYFRSLTGVYVIQYSRGMVPIPVVIVIISLITGVLAGLIPSLRYSNVKLLHLVKDVNRHQNKGFSFRRILLVSQLLISVGLLMLILLFYNQLRFLSVSDPGFETQNRLVLNTPYGYEFDFPVLKKELMRIPGIETVTATATDLGKSGGDLKVERLDAGENAGIIEAHSFCVQEDFFTTYGIPVVQGHDFSYSTGRDSSEVIIDRYTAHLLGLAEEPIGARLEAFGVQATVVGVIDEVNLLPMNQSRMPVIFNQFYDFGGQIAIRYTGERSFVEREAEAALKSFDAKYEMEAYSFQEVLDQYYAKEQNLLEIILNIGIIALILSLVGVYAMSAYMAEKRSREICIRKVHGASVQLLLQNAIRELALLVTLASVLAIPVALWVSHRWKENFQVKAQTGFMPILIAVASVFLLSWLTMYYKNRQAALANPADVLRHE